jgi:hypothetical protein
LRKQRRQTWRDVPKLTPNKLASCTRSQQKYFYLKTLHTKRLLNILKIQQRLITFP